MTKKPVIACVGEAMVELSFDRPEQQIGFAGDTLNTAVYLTRAAGAAAQVEFVTVLGRDAVSDRMSAFIAAQGVGCARIRRHPERLPGIYAIALDAEGERSFSYWRDQSAARCLFEDGFAQLEGVDLIYLSAITLAILPHSVRLSLLAHLEAHPARVAFDSNYRPRLWEDIETARAVTEAAWRIADIALPSLDDEMALFGDRDAQAVRARLNGWGARKGALKMGAGGAISLDPTAKPLDLAAAQKVVDTTAAGDSFNGAWLAAHFRGASDKDCLVQAHACALEVIAQPGAIIAA
ncbi:sugar kinase [Thioclava sp.]|uniref:sugar kinase n=1 Tax=Thioclava sp. TaxID=1933450 RepID=UPI0032421196